MDDKKKRISREEAFAMMLATPGTRFAHESFSIHQHCFVSKHSGQFCTTYVDGCSHTDMNHAYIGSCFEHGWICLEQEDIVRAHDMLFDVHACMSHWDDVF